MKSLLASLTLAPVAFATFATAAHADTPATATRDDANSTVRLSLMTGAAGSDYGAGVDGGLALDLRLDSVILGAMGTVAFGTGSEYLLGLRAGYDFSTNDNLSLDLIAEGGFRMAKAGGGIMSDDPGVRAGEGFLGLRFSVDYAVNDVTDPVVFRIGVSAFGRASLGGRDNVEYSYESCSIFGGDCTTESTTRDVGGVHDFGATLNLSLDFGHW